MESAGKRDFCHSCANRAGLRMKQKNTRTTQFFGARKNPRLKMLAFQPEKVLNDAKGHNIVVPNVAGSNPVIRPRFIFDKFNFCYIICKQGANNERNVLPFFLEEGSLRYRLRMHKVPR